MKKILIISNVTNGLYLFRADLIRNITKNYKVIVLAEDTGRKDDLRKLGCSVKSIPFDRRGMNPFHELKLMSTFYRFIKRIAPDYIITYTIKPNIYGGLISGLLKIPYSVNITGLGTGFQSKIKRFILTKLYSVSLKKAHVVFTENSSIKEELIHYHISSEKKICVLDGAGVNLKTFDYIDYPVDSDAFHFLFVGRVMREKGINELISTIERLNNNGYPCSLTIIGGMEEDYKNRIAQNPFIHYEGWQEDVRPFIAQTHCSVLPSYHEGMSNTNLECAASGRPIITSNIPGCREAVIDGKTGYLCTAHDENSLYTTMKRMMLLSNSERKNMGIAGRKLMAEQFDKNKVVSETINQLDLP